MRKTTFGFLVEALAAINGYETLYERGVPFVPVEKKTLVALSYMATQLSMRKIGDQFNLADSTVWSCIDSFLTAMSQPQIQCQYIKWPTEEESVIIERNFRALAKFPG